jgi:hypothetical protein
VELENAASPGTARALASRFRLCSRGAKRGRATAHCVVPSPVPRLRLAVELRLDPTGRLGRTGDALALELLFADGLGIRSDGSYARWLELDALNPWVLDSQERDRLSTALAGVLQRVPEAQTITFVAEARPAPVRDMCEHARRRAMEALRHGPVPPAHGYGVARLQHMFEENLLELAQRHAALEYRYVVVVSHRPPGPLLRRRPVTVAQRVHERRAARVDQLVESVQRALSGLRIGNQVWSGREVAEALWQAWNPSSARASTLALGPLEDRVLAERAPSTPRAARRAATVLRDTIAASGYSSDGTTLQLEQDRHITVAIDRRPTHTSLGWLLPATETGLPFRLVVHLTPRSQTKMRRSIRAQYAMARATGRADARAGQVEDFDNSTLEAEVYGLNQRLSDPTQTLRFYDASIYLTLRQPAGTGDEEALLDAGRRVRDELADRAGAGVTLGGQDQLDLFRSATPLGIDHARYREPYTSDVVGQLLPVLGSDCGSPDGVPLFLLGDRSIGRWDPIDPLAMNWLLTIVGAAGSGKTFVLEEFARALLRGGMPGFVIDHADHFAPLAESIGGAYVELGGGEGQHRLNPWDVADPARVEPDKYAFLLNLHAALIGDAQGSEDLGLSKTEQALLRSALRRVYADAAANPDAPDRRPCESRLRDVLAERADEEAAAGAAERAALLRDLHDRVAGFCGDEPEAWLVDGETTVPHDVPVVVFNTASVGDALAAPAMLAITDYVQRYAHARRGVRAVLQELPDEERRLLAWTGYCFLISDETWAAMSRAATGRAINTFARKSRHLGVVFLAATQRFADFDNEWGRALLSSATQRIFLKQNPNDFAVLREIAGLSDHIVQLIEEHVQTQPGYESRGYWMNGVRGSGLFALRVGLRCYWASTSNPRDVPVREHAIARAGGDFWAGIDALVEEGMQPLAA